MNKKELAILERAFESEFKAALEKTPLPIQGKGKIYKKMVDDHLLEPYTGIWRGINITGYVLTHVGRMAYCMTCEDESAAV